MKKISNKILLSFASLATILSIAITLIIVLNPFENIDPLYVSGKALFIKIYEPVKQDSTSYSLDISSDIIFNIKPKRNEEILLIDIEITNGASSEIRFNVDEKAADLLSKDGYTYYPVNPSVGTKIAGNEELYGYPIWGKYILKQNEMLRGFLIFMVSKNSNPERFNWLASDNVLIYLN